MIVRIVIGSLCESSQQTGVAPKTDPKESHELMKTVQIGWNDRVFQMHHFVVKVFF